MRINLLNIFLLFFITHNSFLNCGGPRNFLRSLSNLDLKERYILRTTSDSQIQIKQKQAVDFNSRTSDHLSIYEQYKIKNALRIVNDKNFEFKETYSRLKDPTFYDLCLLLCTTKDIELYAKTLKIIKSFLGHNVNPNKLSLGNEYPIYCAIKYDNEELLALLLEFGATLHFDVNLKGIKISKTIEHLFEHYSTSRSEKELFIKESAINMLLCKNDFLSIIKNIKLYLNDLTYAEKISYYIYFINQILIFRDVSECQILPINHKLLLYLLASFFTTDDTLVQCLICLKPFLKEFYEDICNKYMEQAEFKDSAQILKELYS